MDILCFWRFSYLTSGNYRAPACLPCASETFNLNGHLHCPRRQDLPNPCQLPPSTFFFFSKSFSPPTALPRSIHAASELLCNFALILLFKPIFSFVPPASAVAAVATCFLPPCPRCAPPFSSSSPAMNQPSLAPKLPGLSGLAQTSLEEKGQ